MYKRGIYEIVSNEPLTATVWRMVLEGDTQYITAPGQFVNIELEGRFLRRPISVCDYDGGTITIVYKILGDGTEQMSLMRPEETLDLLTGLGNGFSVEESVRKPLLVGGGVGIPPLYNLAKRLIATGQKVGVVLGCNSAGELFFEREFAALGAGVYVSTVDGSRGTCGLVTDAIRDNDIEHDYIYACGPVPMLRALSESARCEGQLSFEERMGCGFGGCMGCSCKTKYGYKRICKEGPVLKIDEVVW